MLGIFLFVVASAILSVFLYFVVGIIVGMYHVSRLDDEYDVFDFLGVMMCWPKYLYNRKRGRPWNVGGFIPTKLLIILAGLFLLALIVGYFNGLGG